MNLDWSQLSQVRLTKQYAELLGTQQWSLGELAQAYGYELENGPDRLAPPAYSEYQSGWRLSAIRRSFDSLLGIPSFVNIIEYPDQLTVNI